MSAATIHDVPLQDVRLDVSNVPLHEETIRLAQDLALATVRLKTALEEKERLSRMLDQVLETIETGVVLHAADGRLLAANGAARRMGAALPVTETTFALAPSIAALAPGDGDRPFRPRGLSGPTWVARRGTVPLPDGGEGHLVTVQDVTRAVRLEEQAGRRTRLEALGRMAAEIAHEVRNPLGSLELFASLLADELRAEGRGEGTYELADQILLGVRRLSGTVTHLLAAVRGRPLSRALVDAAALAREACAALAPIAQSRRVTVAAPAADERAPAQLDAEGLRQALLNLVGNALDVTPAGGAVAVAVRAGGGELAFEVADSGPGVPPELRERIFEPFFTTRSQGTGLGLAVVERVALSHGGAIEVTDGPLGGALFRLVLPDGNATTDPENS